MDKTRSSLKFSFLSRIIGLNKVSNLSTIIKES